MITGFNTDIKHGERVFHVQTEDRGLNNPVVESLVYVGGEILLSKRSSYKDQVRDAKIDEKLVKEMMDLQHRRIIEAIRRGRFDGVRPGEMPTVDDPPAAGPQVSPAAAAATAALLASKSGPFPAIRSPEPPAAVSRPPVVTKPTPPPPAPAPRPASAPAMPRPAGLEGPASGVGLRSPSGSLPRMPKPVSVTPAVPPPRPGAAPVSGGGERSLDQVIIEYLASEAASEHLELSLMSGGELIAGESVPLTIRACTSLTEKPVAGAHVSVRVVSTSGPPQILFRGVTGGDGLVKATCTIPDLGTASAALIIAASSSLGNNELKQLVRRKK